MKIDKYELKEAEKTEIMKQLTKIRKAHYERALSQQECIDSMTNFQRAFERPEMPQDYRYKTTIRRLKELGL